MWYHVSSKFICEHLGYIEEIWISQEMSILMVLLPLHVFIFVITFMKHQSEFIIINMAIFISLASRHPALNEIRGRRMIMNFK
jgi:hypothetical protein